MKAFVVLLASFDEVTIKLVDEAGWDFIQKGILTEPVIEAHMKETGVSYLQAKDELTFDGNETSNDRAVSSFASVFDGEQFNNTSIFAMIEFIKEKKLDLQMQQFSGQHY